MINAKRDSSILLKVSNLSVDFTTSSQNVSVVENISFNVNRGEIVAIVGESGCGKSVTCLSIAKLIDDSISSTSGSIVLTSVTGKYEILHLNKKTLRSLRGGKIAYVFQDPANSLNPVFKVKEQLCEAIDEHNPDIVDTEARATELLNLVGISDPSYRMNSYPCQLSGGMQQRVMIAMALAGNPEILIADEPTTALDVTVQSQILSLLKEINQRTQMSILFVTHNLGIVAQLADKVLIMYAGNIVESALISEIFNNPRHPYTKALLSSTPVLGSGKTILESIPGSVCSFSKDYKGCRFAQRCSLSKAIAQTSSECTLLIPNDVLVGYNHHCKCHFCI